MGEEGGACLSASCKHMSCCGHNGNFSAASTPHPEPQPQATSQPGERGSACRPALQQSHAPECQLAEQQLKRDH